MTRKFTLSQKSNASCSPAAREQLFCQGRGYAADSSTAAIGRQRDDFQKRHSKSTAEVPRRTSRTSNLPNSTSGMVTVRRTVKHGSRSLAQLAQSMSIQLVQPRRTGATPHFTTQSRESTAINPTPDPDGDDNYIS